MTPAPSGPLTAGEFSERLEALGAPRRLLLAVSGGPDSMALARLCRAPKSPPRPSITVCVTPRAARPSRRGAGAGKPDSPMRS
jgi:PP-loop superfamily ATP-utilizing enzyme